MTPGPEPVVCVNGRFSPQSQAAISVFDHGFLYGDGVFDTSCAWNGRVFMLDQHLDRLYRSVAATQIPFSMPREELKDLILETVRRNALTEAYIKVVVSRGVSPEPLLDPRDCDPALVIFARPYLSLFAGDAADRGIRVKVTSIRRVSHEALDPKIKSLNYLNLVLAKLEAIQSGADDALLLDEHGYVCEGPGFNVFAVRGGQLLTPARSILVGITRGVVLQIAEGLEVPASEEDVSVYDLCTADEVFVCSTAGGIVPVTAVDGRTIGDGRVGALTGVIRDAYLRLLAEGEHGTPVYPGGEV